MNQENKKKVMVVIPARGGSKEIIGKNLKPYLGEPLISHSIKQAFLMGDLIDKVLITTDSEEIARVAKETDPRVWIPFYRPKEISDDLSTDLEFFQHLIEWIKENQPEELPDILIHLRPTYPYRKIKDLKDALKLYLDNLDYDCLRSVFPFKGKSPLKMFVSDQNNGLKPLVYEINGIKEPYNQPRQLLPTIYSCNGYLDIIKRETIENGSVSGTKIYPFIMSEDSTDDLDTLDDWKKSEKKQIQSMNTKKME